MRRVRVQYVMRAVARGTQPVQVAQEVHGPMLELLAEAIDCHGRECINIFRQGGVLHGRLPPCGNGVPREPEEAFDPMVLQHGCRERNLKVRVA